MIKLYKAPELRAKSIVLYICAECGGMGVALVDKGKQPICEYCAGDSADYIEVKNLEKTREQMRDAFIEVSDWREKLLEGENHEDLSADHPH